MVIAANGKGGYWTDAFVTARSTCARRTVFSALSGMRLLACLIVVPRQGNDEPGFSLLNNQVIVSDER